MRPNDFLSLIAICAVWALNAVLMRHAIFTLGFPPLFLASARFLLAAAVLAPLLRPLPKAPFRTIGVGLLMGAGHFGFLFLGFQQVESSSAAIALQFGIPLTAVLSALILRERISALRLIGIALAFVGILVVLWRPGGMTAGHGLVLILLSAASLAFGSVLLKRIGADMSPLRIQAWTATSSILPLALASWMFEADPTPVVVRQPFAFTGTLLFSALIVTVFSHTAYFRLLQRYEASLVVPLTLMFPLFTVALGMALLAERPGIAFVVGGFLVLFGVFAVVRRPAPLPASG